MNSHSYAHLIFDKSAKDIQWRKDSFSKFCQEKWLYACMFITLYKYQLKMIKDLNIRHETLKLVQERIRNTLEIIMIGKDFLNGAPAAQQLRERMDKWDFIKLRSFCTTIEMVSKLMRPPTEWEKIFARFTSDKGQTNRIYRELK
jgi:hypothetical protein